MAGPKEVPPPLSRGGFPESAGPQARWNYIWHLLEGGLYMGGISFMALDTVMPNMVNSFGGPEWLISITPLLMAAGVMGPQLIAAHWIERLESVHRYTILIGLFQRLPYLGGMLGMLFLGDRFPMLAVAVALSAPLLSGLFSGIAAPAWKELVSRTVPPERRASLHALRNTFAAIISLFAGWVIHEVLKNKPGPDGYAILYGIAFSLVMISWFGFRQLREVPQPDRINREGLTLKAKLRQLPGLLKEDRQLGLMCLASFTGPSIFVVIPFAAVYATQVTGLGESFVGILVIAKTSGLFLGNLIGGYFGDTRGGRLPLILSRIFRILFCLGIPFAVTKESLLLLFFLYGMSFTLNIVGNQVLALEISPDGKRPTYLGIISAATFPGILLAPVVSSSLRFVSSAIWPLALAAMMGTFISLVALYWMEEPRIRFPGAH